MHRVNHKRTAVAAIVLATFVILPYALAAGTKLSFRPSKGASAKYSITMTQKMSGSNKMADGSTGKVGQNVAVSATVREVVTSTSDKGATLSFTFGSAKVTVNGKTTDSAKQLNAGKLSVTINPKGVATGMTGGSNLEPGAKLLASSLCSAMIPLPDKVVAVGEKWSQNSGQGGPMPMKITCKFVGIETRGGKSVAKITMTISGSVSNADQIAAATGPDKPPLTKILLAGNCTYYVEVDSGMPVDATATVKVDSSGGATIHQTQTMTLKRIGN